MGRFGYSRKAPTHSLAVRISHWVNAFALFIMIGSGWGIYNLSPLFSFSFPRHLTLGGWLAGNLAWHFAGMWLLTLNMLCYLFFGFVSGHFSSSFLPLRAAEVLDDLQLAMRSRLMHQPGHYNAIQRLLYVMAILGIVGSCVSGLAIWKPIQLAPLCNLLGGYEAARRVHFVIMCGIVFFIFIHVSMVCKYPRTLRPMVTG
jgi:thiosulfate reductase cytochrome b subunit